MVWLEKNYKQIQRSLKMFTSLTMWLRKSPKTQIRATSTLLAYLNPVKRSS